MDAPLTANGFRTGPAVPVVRASQASFAEPEQPGLFSGGGSSGDDACTSQLKVDEHVEATTYRGTRVVA